MVTAPRPATPTVKFIDDYCQNYEHLFSDVRNYEAFKLLHLGLLSELPRKSLPRIARAVGLSNSQSLNHFLSDSSYSCQSVRQMRLGIILAFNRRPKNCPLY
ncbi:hypothetical protein [Phormidium nigroviride]